MASQTTFLARAESLPLCVVGGQDPGNKTRITVPLPQGAAAAGSLEQNTHTTVPLPHAAAGSWKYITNCHTTTDYTALVINIYVAINRSSWPSGSNAPIYTHPSLCFNGN